MTTLAIIVTYANRFHLLFEVINSCFLNGVNEVLVVDNNSTKNSKKNLKALADHNDKINVLWNDRNLGSAKAYKQGLRYTDKLKDNYILLLDDDNKLKKNALKVLENHWKNKKNNKTKALLAYRPDRQLYKVAIQIGKPEYVLSPRNSFYGFDVLSKLTKLFKIYRYEKKDNSSGEIAYAPFGGMFFHQSLINEIGYPREDFFLYSDDHEWSYRIYKKGFSIELVLDSEIEDIDKSWAVGKKNIFKTIKTADLKRVYYTIRNRIVFEKKERVKHKLIYQINMMVFTFILFLYCKNNTQYKLYKKATRDAFNNNLGQQADDYFNH